MPFEQSLMLVINDVPKCCGLCKLSIQYKHKRRQYMYCYTKKMLSFDDYCYSRPEDYPLHTVPKYKPTCRDKYLSTRGDIENEGWNNCLDEILRYGDIFYWKNHIL